MSQKIKDKHKKRRRNITLIYITVIFLVITLLNTLLGPKLEEISYSQLLQMGDDGLLQEVIIEGDRIYAAPIDQDTSKKYPPMYYAVSIGDTQGLAKRLDEWDIESYSGKMLDTTSVQYTFTSWVLPLVILIGIWFFVFKVMGKKMGSPMEFGKNKEKVYAQKNTGVTFDDVAGQTEAKEQLVEIVDFLHQPDKYVRLGATLPKGALLVGPPGTGKTLLAKAVAGEANVPFFSMSGPEFVQMFVGVGASRVRDLFTQAQEKAPCIVFIDEIDAIGKSRANSASTNDEREQTLNQLLTELDGFDSKKSVVILAATNRPEVLDAALLRPGRFDRRIIVDKPDLPGREAIFKVHAKNIITADNVNYNALAKATAGAVGADIANIINEAALIAIRKDHDAVMQEDIYEAIEVNIAGTYKKDRILSANEKLTVSYHEIGHALIAKMLPSTDPVHKISIIPTSKGALGYTMQLPTEDKHLITKEEMLDRVCVLLGGRCAEEISIGAISTGAANDIERATKMVRQMITIYGMSDEFDMMGLEAMGSQYLDGTPIRTCSTHTYKRIDDIVLDMISDQHKRGKNILNNNIEALDKCTQYLLDNETILGEEFDEILKDIELADIT